MSDPNAPTSRDVRNALLILGVATLAGIALAYLLPSGIGHTSFSGSRNGVWML